MFLGLFSYSNYWCNVSLPVGVGVFLRRENPVFAFRGRHFGRARASKIQHGARLANGTGFPR